MNRRNKNVLRGRRMAAMTLAVALSVGLLGVSATADAQTYEGRNPGSAPQAAEVTPAAGKAKSRAPGIRWEHTVRQMSFTWHGYEVRQFSGYVVFLFGSGTRIIHLDGKPHLPEQIKLWNGDSRGHWEGNTLVVDVSNNNAKARFARTGEFASEHVKIE